MFDALSVTRHTTLSVSLFCSIMGSISAAIHIPVCQPLNDTNDSSMPRGSQPTNECTVAAKKEWQLRSVHISRVSDREWADSNLFWMAHTLRKTALGNSCWDRRLRDGRWNMGSMSLQKAMKWGFSTMDRGNPHPTMIFSTSEAVLLTWSGLLRP